MQNRRKFSNTLTFLYIWEPLSTQCVSATTGKCRCKPVWLSCALRYTGQEGPFNNTFVFVRRMHRDIYRDVVFTRWNWNGIYIDELIRIRSSVSLSLFFATYVLVGWLLIFGRDENKTKLEGRLTFQLENSERFELCISFYFIGCELWCNEANWIGIAFSVKEKSSYILAAVAKQSNRFFNNLLSLIVIRSLREASNFCQVVRDF